MNPLLTATHMAQWSETRDAQGMLPLLVRRLILASVTPTLIDFPAGDSVSRPGYDGRLRTTEGDAHAPAGLSVWEMGTTEDVAQKANGDYAARTANPNGVVPAGAAFVFVTPRRWQRKLVWADERRAEGVWASVRCLDAEDLEQWLERCPAVAAWARGEILGTPEGIRTLEEVWRGWSTRTMPALVTGLFTGGRDSEVERVRAWLDGPPSLLRVQDNTEDEAAGFLAAVVESSVQTRELVYARAAVADTPVVWRAVTGGRTPGVIVATASVASEPARAVQRGHHVAILYGRSSAGARADIRLGALRRRDVGAALDQMAIPSERSRRLAAESRGRVAAVVDLLNGNVVAPDWATPDAAPELVPFLLAGSWTGTESDIAAVCRLAGVESGEVTRRLSCWANVSDPPVRRVGASWEWASRLRAWPYLSGHITDSNLTAFAAVAREVLGEPDPRLELEPEQRWAHGLYGQPARFSGTLRKGLADTLAILASRPEQLLASRHPAGLAASIVRELFGDTPDPDRWYSLANVLPSLAEAAPEAFLAAVERDVLGDADVRELLFADEGQFRWGRYTHLLWALEALAWSPQYLPQVALALGELSVGEPGGNRGNRPSASLRIIFLTWLPHTTASVAQRIAAIDALHRRHPAVAFDLCARLTAAGSDVANPTSRPRFRNWAPDHRVTVRVSDYNDYLQQLFDRLLSWAGGDRVRWATLLQPMRYDNDEQLGRLLDGLAALNLEGMAVGGDELRDAVRRVIHQKRTLESVYPELTPDGINRLEEVYNRLTPADLIRREAWLFASHPDLLSVSGRDWEAEYEARDRERAESVQRFLDAGRTDDLEPLAQAAGDPWSVGYTAGRSALTDEDFVRLLERRDEVGSPALGRFANGLIQGRYLRDGWPWVERLFESDRCRNWPDARKAAFATILPFAAETWDWLERWGPVASQAYWEAVSPYTLGPASGAPRAVGAFLAHSRPAAAMELIQLVSGNDGFRSVVTAEVMLDVVRAMTAAATGVAATNEFPAAYGRGMDCALDNVLGELAESGAMSDMELARIEWAWLPALEHSRRGPRTLYQTLEREPGFFVELMRIMYRPRFPDRDDEPAARQDEPAPVADERTRRMGSQAFRILHDWRGIPGAGSDGVVDVPALQAWVGAARALLRESGHVAVGDQHIGQILAHLPTGADGVWPHECLREMLEELRSNDIETGVYIGVVNGRGMTCREHGEGGDQERVLAARYDAWAEATYRWPRINQVLRRLAENYRRDAQREDEERDMDEFGG